MPSEKLIAYLIAKICMLRGAFFSLLWVFQTIFAALSKNAMVFKSKVRHRNLTF
jgi:hypothetical protein